MVVKLIESEISNFKGINKLVVNYNNKTDINGRNGIGKTTIATSWFWVLTDRDESLKSNPAVYPINVEEATPTVRHRIEIDGKPVEICKMQKRKVSKPDANGVSKVALSNSYEINSVPKSERDFKAYLEENGLNFDIFLALSHTESFTSQKSDEMRKVLFGMVKDVTDLDIAKEMGTVPELESLLEIYKLEEAEAMQKSTMRTIRENYGKGGEIIRSKIEGKETAKADINLEEWTKRRQELEEELSEAKKIMAIEKDRVEKLAKARINLHLAEDKVVEHKREVITKATEESEKIKYDIRSRELDIKGLERDLENTKRRYEEESARVESLKVNYKEVKASSLDSNSTYCTVCGQKFPTAKVLKIMKNFETEKQNKLDYITESGKRSSEERDFLKKEVESLKGKIRRAKEAVSKLNEKLESIGSIDETELDYGKKMDDLNASVEKAKEVVASLSEPIAVPDIDKIMYSIRDVDKLIALDDMNKRLDEQIAELIAEQRNYEQKKADCEKILYQIDLLSRAKNEKLTEEINSKFENVKWKLFDYQKNGEYKAVTIPQYCGKDLGVSTNTGLELMMKLDIINGLQKYYGMNLPVFVDGAECLSADTKNSINMDCQVIWLTVTDGDLEIK